MAKAEVYDRIAEGKFRRVFDNLNLVQIYIVVASPRIPTGNVNTVKEQFPR